MIVQQGGGTVPAARTGRPARAGTAPRARADPPRRRTGGGLLGLPPWRRAPLLPFGQPAVLVAVAAAAAILACASSSAALFLSSASSASLQRLVAAECPDAAAVAVKATGPAGAEREATPRVEAAMRQVGAGTPALSLQPLDPVTFGDPARGDPVRALYRVGALDNITRLSGSTGTRGLWISEATASRTAPAPGTGSRRGSRASWWPASTATCSRSRRGRSGARTGR